MTHRGHHETSRKKRRERAFVKQYLVAPDWPTGKALALAVYFGLWMIVKTLASKSDSYVEFRLQKAQKDEYHDYFALDIFPSHRQ
jgi:hypothetical protein